MKLTDSQYTAVLNLFNEFQEAFRTLSQEVQGAFYDRLYDHSKR